jgi:hypothetical protein
MYFPGFPAATPLLKGGQVKILAVSSAKRAGGAPDVPTVAEAISDPNFDLTLWQGFFAPAGTPARGGGPAQHRDQRDPGLAGMQAKLRDAGADVRLGSSAQFGVSPRPRAKSIFRSSRNRA